MKNKILILMLSFFAGVVLFTSCRKDTSLNGAGIDVVSFPTYANIYSYDLVAGSQTFSILTISRDVPNSTVLNTPQTVSVKLDSTVLDDYNTANGTDYITLDPSVYTFDASTPVSSSVMTVTFAAGEYRKVIKINLDLTKLPQGNNAIGFTITQTTPGIISNQSSKGIVAIGAKNRFDGVYTLTGTMVDNVNGALSGNYPTTVDFISNGPSQVNMYDEAVPGIYHSIQNNGAPSYYGSLGVVFNFNDDNTVSSVVNYYGQPAGNTRSLQLDPSGVNKWDPETKTLKVKYWMNQPSVTADHRTSFDETYTYKGPR